MLINIHTHKRTNEENQLEIVIDEDTIGVHPWHVTSVPDYSKARERCYMIGETGLDRSERYKQTWPLQIKMLMLHLKAALKFKLPIVLHCVRAHSDLLEILKELNYPGKILLHDFSGNTQQLNAYLKYDTYFSFTLKRNIEVSRVAPPDRIFLETDDDNRKSIQEIYKLSSISEIQFEKNYLNLFSDSQNVSSSDVINYFRLALITH